MEGLREHDARVHLCDISPEAIAECRASLPGVTAAVVDVAAVDQVDAFFDAALDALGGLDILVNNAGIAGPAAAVEDITVEDWDRTVAVNLNSQFYCARRAVPALRASGRGALINLSSVAGTARLRLSIGVRGDQMGCRRLHPESGQGARSRRHPRERHPARRGRRRAVR